MTERARPPHQRVQLLDAARDDLRSLAQRSPVVLREVFRQLKLLDEGRVQPRPLQSFGKTGDLTDCGKIVVALAGEPEHRIVVRKIGDAIVVYEVVAVADRTGDLPYLLAGLRLGRLEDPVRRSDARRRVHRIRGLLGRE